LKSDMATPGESEGEIWRQSPTLTVSSGLDADPPVQSTGKSFHLLHFFRN